MSLQKAKVIAAAMAHCIILLTSLHRWDKLHDVGEVCKDALFSDARAETCLLVNWGLATDDEIFQPNDVIGTLAMVAGYILGRYVLRGAKL